VSNLIIGVRFLTKDVPSKTEYLYEIDKDKFEYIEKTYDLEKDTFVITNDKGYDYRGSSVIITKIYSFSTISKDKLEGRGLSTIVSINRRSWENFPHPVKDNREPVFITTFSKKETKDTKKGDNNMFNKIFKNVEMGKATDVVFSVNGPAFKTAEGTYISKNKKDEGYTEVDGLTFDSMDSFCYMVPVSKKDVVVGDYVRHNGSWVRVIEVLENGSLRVDKIFAQERVEIIPTKNIFGFDFYVKLVSLTEDLFGASANEANPFGNTLPFLLLSEDGSKDFDKFLPFILMGNGSFGGESMKNLLPLMLFSGDKGGKMNDLLPLMLMGENLFGNK
jgi:hypothetical protein